MDNGEDGIDLDPLKLRTIHQALCNMDGSATPEGVAEVTGLSLTLVEEAIEKLKELRLIEETTDIGALRYTTSTV